MNKLLLNNLNKIHNNKKYGYNSFSVFNKIYTSRNYKKRKNIFYKRFMTSDYNSMNNKIENENDNKKKSKKKNIFLTWKCLGVNLLLSIPALYLYLYQYEKNKKKSVIKTTMESIGKPLIGGDFTLINHHGNIITNKSFKDKFCLIYFGFTYCPDICPQELEKQTIVIEKIHKKYGDIITPIFISVDPQRDTVAQINYYCKSFSPKLIGLTGTKELIKHVSKLFRVYYNENVTDINYSKENESISKNEKYNYLIDHSIIHYLLDTNGNFLDFFGKNATTSEMVDKISQYIDEHMHKQKNYTKNVIGIQA
ncbi:Cg3 protein [Plasmodium sp. gorilla clade G2]|uniref:Cg3 protein n=1 Tax=Plasmodium sp. gorilla clade G2 TaxID=880535 RepID=UPI000D208E02|nr:Cg3 protein [Plasmodium sp. gorilla clade G2]SOV12933.1 Cg3 protein [Plasmodium sp. gorilla clade G2]